MPHSSLTKKVLVITIILNILIWGAFNYIFLKIRSENQKNSILLNEATNNIKKEESLRSTKASLNENKSPISKLDSYFVASDGVVDFIESLETLGRRWGVVISIDSVSVEADSKNKNDFKEILKMNVKTAGLWKNNMNFISSLENFSYKIDINQVSLSRDGEGGGNWRGNFNIRILKLK